MGLSKRGRRGERKEDGGVGVCYITYSLLRLCFSSKVASRPIVMATRGGALNPLVFIWIEIRTEMNRARSQSNVNDEKKTLKRNIRCMTFRVKLDSTSGSHTKRGEIRVISLTELLTYANITEQSN